MERFLIVRTSALGDILHGMPVAEALKERFPYCRISWVADARYQELMEALPSVDEILLVRRKAGKSFPAGRGKGRSGSTLRRALRRGRFDVVIDLQGLIRAGWISYLAGAPVRIGFSRPHVREWPNQLFSNVHPRSIPARSHVIDRNLALLHPLGIHTRRRVVRLRSCPHAEERVRGFLEEIGAGRSRLRVAIQPSAGWSTKQWCPQRYAEIGDRMARAWSADVFLLWGPGERERAQEVQVSMREPGHVVPEMGLAALIAFLRQCHLLVGGDTGPLHLASALGIPVVGLYGPSDPVRNGPFQAPCRTVTASVACGPCYKRTCPDGMCMDSISVDEVWGALQGVYKRPGEVPGAGQEAGPSGRIPGSRQRKRGDRDGD